MNNERDAEGGKIFFVKTFSDGIQCDMAMIRSGSVTYENVVFVFNILHMFSSDFLIISNLALF